MPQPLFRYDPAIIERYPTIVGGTLHVTGASNGPTPATLAQAYAQEQQQTLARIGATPLSELPSVNAWRRAFRAFGVDPTQYRSAAESLLRRLTKQGSIPSIDTLVDIGNLVSIRYALPVAILDLASIQDGLWSVSRPATSGSPTSVRVRPRRPSPARSSSSMPPATSPRAAGAGGSRPRAPARHDHGHARDRRGPP